MRPPARQRKQENKGSVVAFFDMFSFPIFHFAVCSVRSFICHVLSLYPELNLFYKAQKIDTFTANECREIKNSLRILYGYKVLLLWHKTHHFIHLRNLWQANEKKTHTHTLLCTQTHRDMHTN